MKPSREYFRNLDYCGDRINSDRLMVLWSIVRMKYWKQVRIDAFIDNHEEMVLKATKNVREHKDFQISLLAKMKRVKLAKMIQKYDI